MTAVSALGRRSGTLVERLYCESWQNGLVRIKVNTWLARLPCLRSFTAARLANSVTASFSSVKLVVDADSNLTRLPVID